MVTCVPGKSRCTTLATTWAASWRIRSRPSRCLLVTTVSFPLRLSGRERSRSSSSSLAYSAVLASPAPICVFTKSATVVPAATCLLEPSGSVIRSVSDMTNLYNAKGPARVPDRRLCSHHEECWPTISSSGLREREQGGERCDEIGRAHV